MNKNLVAVNMAKKIGKGTTKHFVLSVLLSSEQELSLDECFSRARGICTQIGVSGFVPKQILRPSKKSAC
jgi:hypothetical protein